MNRQQLLDLIEQLFSSIRTHPKVYAELLRQASGSGYERQLLALLQVRLSYLLDFGASAVHAKEFESIGSGLFSMHLTGKGFNIRILYSFLPDQSPVLLLAFYERAGKKNTDYSSYLAPALSRLKEETEVTHGS